MVLYDIYLRIQYDYETPAAGGRHILKLLSATIEGTQRLIASHVDIHPQPSESYEIQDFFGTRTTNVAFRSMHSEIVYAMYARIERSDSDRFPLQSMSLTDLLLLLEKYKSLEHDAPVHFTGPSRRSGIIDTLTSYARQWITPAMDAASIVRTIGEALNRDMVFDAEATTVDTPAIEAFENRRGVCQDFSHIMISCLRGIGIPAGYVSGFLRTKPPPGQPRLEGADAMHAWVRAWCGPAAGWVEYDPTNAMTVAGDHIVIGYGRDYSDVSPVKGISRVAGGQTTKQTVDVLQLS